MMNHSKFALACLSLYLLFCVLPGCGKKAEEDIACAHMYVERPMEMVRLKFQDKLTGESLLGSNGYQASDIRVVELSTNKVVSSWRLFEGGANKDVKDVLEIALLERVAGAYRYQIFLGTGKTAILTFNMKMHKSSSPCLADYLQAVDYKITDQSYEPVKIGDKVYDNFLVVKI